MDHRLLKSARNEQSFWNSLLCAVYIQDIGEICLSFVALNKFCLLIISPNSNSATRARWVVYSLLCSALFSPIYLVSVIFSKFRFSPLSFAKLKIKLLFAYKKNIINTNLIQISWQSFLIVFLKVFLLISSLNTFSHFDYFQEVKLFSMEEKRISTSGE